MTTSAAGFFWLLSSSAILSIPLVEYVGRNMLLPDTADLMLQSVVFMAAAN